MFIKNESGPPCQLLCPLGHSLISDDMLTFSHVTIMSPAIKRQTHDVWSMAESLWLHGPQSWPEIKIRTILSIGSVELPGIRLRNNSPSTPTVREQIQDEMQTVLNIKKGWLRAINNRLIEDKIMATKIKKDDPKHTNLIKETWKDVLKAQGLQHDNWLLTEVFSG